MIVNPDYERFNIGLPNGRVDLRAFVEIPISWLTAEVRQSMRFSKKRTWDEQTQAFIEENKTIEDYSIFIRESDTEQKAIISLFDDNDSKFGDREEPVSEAEFDEVMQLIALAGAGPADCLTFAELSQIFADSADPNSSLSHRYSGTYRVFADDTELVALLDTGGGPGGKK